MRIKVYEIPQGYGIKKWGHIGNHEMWWGDASMAYLERRILLKYNKRDKPDMWLVYYDKKRDKYTVLARR